MVDNLHEIQILLPILDSASKIDKRQIRGVENRLSITGYLGYTISQVSINYEPRVEGLLSLTHLGNVSLRSYIVVVSLAFT